MQCVLIELAYQCMRPPELMPPKVLRRMDRSGGLTPHEGLFQAHCEGG
jgi:hypothetical protein